MKYKCNLYKKSIQLYCPGCFRPSEAFHVGHELRHLVVPLLDDAIPAEDEAAAGVSAPSSASVSNRRPWLDHHQVGGTRSEVDATADFGVVDCRPDGLVVAGPDRDRVLLLVEYVDDVNAVFEPFARWRIVHVSR